MRFKKGPQLRMNIFHILLSAILTILAAAPTSLAQPAQPPLSLSAAAGITNAGPALDDLLHMLPPSGPWEKWLKDTGAQPPDFDIQLGVAELPDPFLFSDGTLVKSRSDWTRRRVQLLDLFQFYVLGHTPPAPDNVRAANLKSSVEGDIRIQGITLEFGPEHRAKLNIQLIVPPGPGPFPVFITQDNHRPWALVAVSRGYIGCIYAGADSLDDTGAFSDVWPKADWSKLTRRAWAASRCVDYLQTLPFVDRAHIALAGHSRNGKTSLIAAALDDRITAVISSSSGAGGACTFRMFSETQFGEGIEMITRVFPDWFNPRLRFFAGRENKLPIDQHELIACVAPRPCLISTAVNDPVESVWAVEQTFYAAQRVYGFLGAAGSLNLRYRPGEHTLGTEDIEAFMDWLDTRFGRRGFAVGQAPLWPTYNDWLKASGERVDPMRFPSAGLNDLRTTASGNPITTKDQWKAKCADIRQRILWTLGDAPAMAENPGGAYGAETRAAAMLLNRPSPGNDVVKESINFGNNLNGDLYYPAGLTNTGRLPAVVWLHPFHNAGGYSPTYRRGESFPITLAKAGFVVFAFDQIGCGGRIEEMQHFYLRHPHWSLLGRTVADTQAAVTLLRHVPFVDSRRIWALGYATGGMAALHAAALDDRIAGVVSVAGFTPMRLDTPNKGTGGIGRWAQWLPWVPRLGAFVGHEDHIPYDYHEVLGLIAPRPALIVLPQIDYQSTRADILQCLDEAHKGYGFLDADDKLSYVELPDYNHFSPEMQQEVIRKLTGI
jgi:dienelactone hydrolase